MLTLRKAIFSQKTQTYPLVCVSISNVNIYMYLHIVLLDISVKKALFSLCFWGVNIRYWLKGPEHILLIIANEKFH